MYKNIRIKKKGGGTRLQRVQVLASGKYKFVKNLVKGKSRKTKSKSRASNPKRGGNRTMAKNKKKGGGKSLQRTIFKWVRIGALVAPAVVTAAEHKGNLYDTAEHTLYRYTGYSMRRSKWEPEGLLEGWGPYLGAVLTTYGIPKLVSIIRRL